MKFLCDHCHRFLTQRLDLAAEFWDKKLWKARALSSALQWDSALTYYGNALGAAEILLTQTDQPRIGIERYLHTALEMTYAIRKGGYFNDLNLFIEQVEIRLKRETLPREVDFYLRPLRDVASSPICAVDMWMHSILDTDSLQHQTSVIH